MTPVVRQRPMADSWLRLRVGLDKLTLYLPVILMGLMALGSYWLARNTHALGPAESQRAPVHEPDYFMRRFSVKTFDVAGRLKSEVIGVEARHYPDTDTLEIDQPRIRSFSLKGEPSVATARRALSNADGSEVQLIGDATVTREATTGPAGETNPRVEIRGEFLHVFADIEQVKSHKPVTLIRGADRFTADSLDYANLERAINLRGRVRGVLVPRPRP